MKNIKLFLVVFAVALTAVVCAAFVNNITGKPAMAANTDGFAVVELFTSEGCSSCPPADELAARVQKENAGKPVYVLAYHVDYWNRLGWKDAFSKAEFSHRQSVYSTWLKLKGVYTPQAIVNGQTEFVGSDRGRLTSAIRNGLNKTAAAIVSLSNIKVTGNSVAIKYNVAGAGAKTSLQLALVQKNAVSNVKSGENGGRTLSHVQIVDELKSIPTGDSKHGEAVLKLPSNFTPAGFELVAFVQNNATGEITGATRAPFPTNVTASN